MPRFRRGAFCLFLLAFAVSMLLGDRPGVVRELRLDVDMFLEGAGWWQPVTAMFLYPSAGLAALAGTLLVQWFLGSPLEGFWGTRRYVIMVTVSAALGYLAVAVLGVWLPELRFVRLSGALPLDLAAVTAFGIVFARHRYSVPGLSPIRGRVLAPVVGALLLLAPLLLGGGVVSLLPGGIASVVAALFATQPWRRLRKSGKVGRRKSRNGDTSHLRVVRRAEDLLN